MAALPQNTAVANFPNIVLSLLSEWVCEGKQNGTDGEDFFNDFLVFFATLVQADPDKFTKIVYERGDENMLFEFCDWYDEYLALIIAEHPRRDDISVFQAFIEVRRGNLLRDYPVLTRLQALCVVALNALPPPAPPAPAP